MWYAQVSYARNFQDHWDLSNSFTPTANEDGGKRDFSRTEDWRVNAKVGFTPNATDEYAISYTRQEGEKNAPLSTTDDITAPIAVGYPTPRYWSWPYWNIENIYFLSTTALGDKATLKTRIYRNTLDNLLRSFDDRTQTTQNAPQPRVFNSPYADEAWGGSAELAVDLTPAEHLAIAFHYRRDKHIEAQQTFPNVATQPQGFTEPPQEDLEDTYSIAAENRFTFTPALSLTVGVSLDWRDLQKAEEYGMPPGSTVNQIFSYPLANSDAFNWQGRLDWAPDSDMAAHVSISRRARFPTIFERFSTQFGTAASNPGLKPERATNVEVGGRKAFGVLKLEGAIFYSKVDDAIVSVRPQGSSATTTRRENLGDGDYYGAEVSLDAQLMPSLAISANYSYIHRSFDINPLASSILPAAFELTDVPTHKAFVYADWEAIKGPARHAQCRNRVEPYPARDLRPAAGQRADGGRPAGLLSRRPLCECRPADRLCGHRDDRDRRRRAQSLRHELRALGWLPRAGAQHLPDGAGEVLTAMSACPAPVPHGKGSEGGVRVTGRPLL